MDLELRLFPAIYTSLCVLYLTFGVDSSNKAVKAVLKCIPIVSLIASTTMYAIPFGMGPIGHQEANDSYERLIFGLIFSCLGDFYLVFQKTFLLGVISFGIAQCIYIALFGGIELLLLNLTPSAIVAGVAILTVAMFSFFLMFPKLTWGLLIPVLVYVILISTMLWCAVRSVLELPDDRNRLIGAIGASLFFISDMVIVLRARFKIPLGSIMVMLTYYSAQLLISLSVTTKFQLDK